MKKNTWKSLINYVNLYHDGQTIKRKNIMKKLANPIRFTEPTLDVYRRYLTASGFLERVGCGKYKKVKHIPIKLARRDAQRMGYDTSSYEKGW